MPIQPFAKRMTNKNNEQVVVSINRIDGIVAATKFMDGVKKLIWVIQVIGNGRFEFASYPLKEYPGEPLSCITLFIAVKFDVSLETLSEPFSVSTPVGDLVYSLANTQKMPSHSHLEIQFNRSCRVRNRKLRVILDMDRYILCMPQMIIELGLFIFNFQTNQS